MTAKRAWAEIIGPCYSETSLVRRFGWTLHGLREAVAALEVLELVTEDDVRLYPAFQFDDGRPVPHLADVLTVLHSGVESPWTWAQWLNTPLVTDVGGELPRNIDRLRAGALGELLLEARNDAYAWGN
ncbi:hypothetical protein ACFY9N_03815 [Microbacterium sp. NPDC008134]|uniref:hypothetical protein n=1 Tax=Microbacterium sp. NPDC008134 TaxID=3364183 RepID=UPI0036E172EE